MNTRGLSNPAFRLCLARLPRAGPQYKKHPFATVFFCICLVIASMFVKNLFVGVVVEAVSPSSPDVDACNVPEFCS